MITASDGTVDVTQSFTITVANVNDPTTFTSTPVTSATQDVSYSYTVETDDIDTGDTVTLTGTTIPSWLTFTAGTGVLAGTPGNSHVGTHEVVITASDGTVDINQSFTITVANVNDAPTGSVTISGRPTQGEVLTASNNIADVDGMETITYTWSNGKTGASITLTQADVDTTITVTASYTDGEGTTESVTSNVTDTVITRIEEEILATAEAARVSTSVISNSILTDSLSSELGITDTGNITSQMVASVSNSVGLLYNGNITIPEKKLSDINPTQQTNLISSIKSSYASELGINENRINVTLSNGSIIVTVDVYYTQEQASSAHVYNNLFIDEIRIITNNGNRFTGIENILHSNNGVVEDDLPTNTVTDTGLKYVVQVTNNSGSIYNPSLNGSIQLRIATVTSENIIYEHGFTYSENVNIEHSNSIYFGWSGNGVNIVSNNVTYVSEAGINTPTTQEMYLADQAINWSMAVGTRFVLYKDDSAIDAVGISYNFINGSSQEIPSIPFLIQGATSLSDLGCGTGCTATGSYTRNLPAKLTQNAPTMTDHTDDWTISRDLTVNGGATGDPHITTLSGVCYKFSHIGPFRFFEDIIDGELLIINGYSDNGITKNGRADWIHSDICGKDVNPEYIKKVFIKYGENHILIDTGFRGYKAKVLEGSGFLYTETSLPFHKRARRMVADRITNTLYKATDPNEPITLALPALTRNQIIVPVYTKNDKLIFNIIIQNINEFNYHPSRIQISFGDIPITQNAKGCVVDRKYTINCNLDDIKSTIQLEEPIPSSWPRHWLPSSLIIPEIEISPKLINAQWK